MLLFLAIVLGLGAQTGAADWLFRTGDPGQKDPLATLQDDLISNPAQVTNVKAEENAPPDFDIDAIPVLVDNALQPALNPVTFRPEAPAHEFITYTVQSGDTAIGIAEKFGIREETILGGNSFLQNDAGQLWAGTEIVILPVDGVLHDVVEGDTLEGLAAQYGVAVEEIVAYEANNLVFPFRLIPGTQLLIPGAVAEVWFWDPPSLAPAAGSGSPEAFQGVYVAVPGTGTFIRPWAGGNITQNPWYGHMAVDIGLVTGSPIYASDTGTVTYAAWSPYGYGNLVVINHGNGFETFYAISTASTSSLGRRSIRAISSPGRGTRANRRARTSTLRSVFRNSKRTPGPIFSRMLCRQRFPRLSGRTDVSPADSKNAAADDFNPH